MNPFSVLTSKIYGGAALALLAALAYVWVSSNATIASYERAINKPVSGWQARLSAATAALATVRGNAAVCEASLARQNEAVQRLSAAAATRLANGAAERAQAASAAASATAVSAKLAQARAGKDTCASADALVMETVK